MRDEPVRGPRPPQPVARQQRLGGHGGHGGHGWMMIVCCIPMLVIAIVLVASGVVGGGFIFAALACTAMMALMMRGMNGMDHGTRDESADRDPTGNADPDHGHMSHTPHPPADQHSRPSRRDPGGP